MGRSASRSRDHGGGVRSLGGVAAAGRSNGGGRGRVASRGGGNWVTSGGGGSRAGGRSRGAAGSRSSGGRLDVAALAGGEAELGAVLVLAGHVVDDLETVAGVALGDGQVGGGSPGEATAVDDALGESGTELDNVGRRALEEEDGDGVGGGGGPGDGEGLTLGDDLGERVSALFLFGFGKGPSRTRRTSEGATVERACAKTYLVQRTGDGVALWVANRGVELGSGNAGEEDDGSVGEHGCFVCFVFCGIRLSLGYQVLEVALQKRAGKE